MKVCSQCKEQKPTESFGRLKSAKDGLSYRCKPCDREQTARWRENNRASHRRMCREWAADNKDRLAYHASEYNKKHRAKRTANEGRRRASKKNATPPWADLKEIDHIYELAREKGLEVDHIVPLVSNIVSGLHVPANLRCIPSELNRSKSNRYWPDMPVGG